MARQEKINTIPFFKHDYYAAADSKLRRLRRAFGASGYAVYFLSLEYLYRNNGEALGLFEIEDIAQDLQLESRDVVNILDYACSDSCGSLLEKNDKGYFSVRFINAFKEAEAERNFYRESGARGGRKAAENKKNADPEPSRV